jgi:hypothetical protein
MASAEAGGALPLPPPPRLAAVSSPSSSTSSAAAATIRAHLARTGGGVDCQASPRSLLSRILLRGGDGGGGFGCRVRLPRRYGRDERKDGGASERGDTPRVKVVERPPSGLPPIDTPRSSLGAAGGTTHSVEITMISVMLIRWINVQGGGSRRRSWRR